MESNVRDIISYFFGHKTFHPDEVAKTLNEFLPKEYDQYFHNILIDLPRRFGDGLPRLPMLGSFMEPEFNALNLVRSHVFMEANWFIKYEYPNRRGPKYYNIPDHDKQFVGNRGWTRASWNEHQWVANIGPVPVRFRSLSSAFLHEEDD